MSKTAFLFPGQGAQTVGMGKVLCETLPAARQLFDEANTLLGYDLAAVCFEGPAEKLNTTVISQPALFVASLAALAALRTSDPAIVDGCAATAGLSLGEYTALVFAVMNIAGNLGAIASPILLGYLNESIRRSGGDWTLVLYPLAGIYLAGAACWLPLDPNRSVVERRRGGFTAEDAEDAEEKTEKDAGTI